jgi:galactitol-specific phosphotransferase system IIC component
MSTDPYDPTITEMLADRDAYQALRRFSHTLALGLTTLMALVTLTPLANLWFRGVAGLSPELAALARQGALLLVLVPGLTALISWQRGVLIHFGHTGAITIATAINIVVLLAAILSGSQLLPIPGVATAALALTMSLASEVAYLTRQAHATRQSYAWA